MINCDRSPKSLQGPSKGGEVRKECNLDLLTTSLTLLSGGICITIGAAAIGSRHADLLKILSLTQIPFNTAVGFFLAGAGMLAVVRGLHLLAMTCGGSIIALAFLRLVAYLFHLNLKIRFPYQPDNPASPLMGANTALCFAVIGISLMVMNRPARQRSLALGSLGSITFTLVMTAFFGYITEVEVGWGSHVRMDLYTGAGFFAFGLGMIATAWRDSQVERNETPEWLPVLVCIGILTVTLFLWQALIKQEPDQLEKAIRIETASKAILIVGLLMSALLAWMVHLAQTAWLRASQVELANHALEREIVERKQAEEALLESEERYAVSIRGANDGLWDWNLKTNDIFFSPRWKSMLGYDEGDIGEKPEEWFNLVHPDDRQRVNEEIAEHIAGQTPHFQSEHRILCKGNAFRWMLSRGLTVRDKEGKATRIAGSQTDITERKMTIEALARQALYDSLTHLPNRLLFIDRLRRSIQRKKRRNDYLFAVLFVDLDRFKAVNDTLGHSIGDRLLIETARKLESCVRSVDSVARLGGDEFTILLEDIRDLKDVTIVADRIQKELISSVNLEGHDLFTTASIGIAFGLPSYAKPEDLLHDADTAMYRAKTLGKGRHEIFSRVQPSL